MDHFSFSYFIAERVSVLFSYFGDGHEHEVLLEVNFNGSRAFDAIGYRYLLGLV